MAASHLLNPLRAETCLLLIHHVVRKIKASNIEYGGIACTGVSGISVAPVVSALLGKKVMVCRKEGERRHSDNHIEIDGLYPKRYIILDDLIDEGHTVDRIMKDVTFQRKDAECVGIALYCPSIIRGAYDGIPIINCFFDTSDKSISARIAKRRDRIAAPTIKESPVLAV